MTAMIWTEDLSVGIEVIDAQHMRIVDYINQLHTAHQTGDKSLMSRVLEELIDYTESHFGFEESILEDAGYVFLKAHQRVHALFIRKIGQFQARHISGEDIAHELHAILVSWLINHIKREDSDYSATVRKHMGETAAVPGWKFRPAPRFCAATGAAPGRWRFGFRRARSADWCLLAEALVAGRAVRLAGRRA
jgi:hemerythrin